MLRGLLPADQFQRWERLNLEKALNAMVGRCRLTL